MPAAIRRALLSLLVLAMPALPARAQAPDVTVFAAASLKTVLDDVIRDYGQRTGRRVQASYAASSALARQVEQGAPADLVITADSDWMDFLASRGLVRQGSRRDLLGNSIVLVAPSDGPAAVALRPGGVREALKGGRLAMASVATVPAGRYGRAALESLGLWPEVQGHVAEAENVRAALSFVARAEAPLGVVYATDAAAEPRVKVVARFPANSHPPIVYPAALTASAKGPEPERFLRALREPFAVERFQRDGFSLLD